MAVRCSKCGEELLGPVNRCWKCGQTFATLPDAGGLPPVRRDVPVAAPLPAIAVAAVVETPSPMASADSPVAGSISQSGPTIRTGSPFAPGAAMVPMASASPTVSTTRSGNQRPNVPATQDLVRDHVAVAGAIGAVVLGVFGMSVAWMANPSAVIGGALLAIVGLALGMWGLHSRRRGWALFGMLLCVAAVSLASYTGAMLLYEAQMEARELEGQIE